MLLDLVKQQKSEDFQFHSVNKGTQWTVISSDVSKTTVQERSKYGAKVVITLGEEELETKQVPVKVMKTGKEKINFTRTLRRF